MALQSFITRALSFCRDYASDVIDEVRWTDAKLLEMLQDANDEVHQELAQASDPRAPFGWIQIPFTITDGQAEYAYPANFRRFRRLLEYDADGLSEREWMLTSPDGDKPGVILLARRRGFRIRPTPDETSSDWKLEYEAGASPYLAYGVVKTGSTATSVICDTVASDSGPLILVDDFYVGQYLTVMLLTAGSERRETRLITDWNKTTKTWTVTPAFSVTPAAADTWEIAPCLDPPEDHAIFWRVVMNMMVARGDAAGFTAADAAYKKSLTRAMRKTFDVNGQLGPAIAFEQADLMGQESYGINA